MIKNYLTVAIRSLLKNKSFVLINSFGLGIALACCIAAYLFVAFNIEFDSFFDDKKVANTFKIHTHYVAKDEPIRPSITAPIVFGTAIANDLAGIKRYTRYVYEGGIISYGDKAFSQGVAFSDSTFFDMFDFPLVAGNHKAFKNKHSIFLSEELAKKYFGNEDPIGKTMSLHFQNEVDIDVAVGGILKKVPVNSTFGFAAMMRIENFIDITKIGNDNWGDWRDPATFVELTSPEKYASFSKQFQKYVPIRNKAKTDVVVASYTLEPFKSNFTQDEIGFSPVQTRMGRPPVLVFTSLAILILLIACFNLTNTSIAMTGQRLKEIGVRKSIGATRGTIIIQFLLETLLTIMLALAVGLGLSQIIVPAFTAMWHLPYTLEELNGVNLVIALLSLVLVAALLAGIYPALSNSRLNPVGLLKGSVRLKGTNGLTRTLIALQFSLSVIMLIGGVMFILNAKFQEEVQFGYDKEMILTMNILTESEYRAMENEMRKHPNVLGISVCEQHIGYSNYPHPVEVDTAKYEVRHSSIGDHYFKTIGLPLVEGRELNSTNTSDLTEGVIVNQAFLKMANLSKDPIDKIVVVHGIRRHIVGVVENHLDNLHRSKEVEPFVFFPLGGAKNYRLMLVRGEEDDLADIKERMEASWKSLFPGRPFESQLQEEILFAESKQVNTNLKSMFLFLTVLGAVLSASGIYSLAALNIARRTKEIGIRKAIGATVTNVVALLNREFMIILTVAVIPGAAAGFYLTDWLLNEIYAYHTPVELTPIVLCALFIFLVGIATTTITILRAATAKPVDTLRSE